MGDDVIHDVTLLRTRVARVARMARATRVARMARATRVAHVACLRA